MFNIKELTGGSVRQSEAILADSHTGNGQRDILYIILSFLRRNHDMRPDTLPALGQQCRIIAAKVA